MLRHLQDKIKSYPTCKKSHLGSVVGLKYSIFLLFCGEGKAQGALVPISSIAKLLCKISWLMQAAIDRKRTVSYKWVSYLFSAAVPEKLEEKVSDGLDLSERD